MEKRRNRVYLAGWIHTLKKLEASRKEPRNRRWEGEKAKRSSKTPSSHPPGGGFYAPPDGPFAELGSSRRSATALLFWAGDGNLQTPLSNRQERKHVIDTSPPPSSSRSRPSETKPAHSSEAFLTTANLFLRTHKGISPPPVLGVPLSSPLCNHGA